MHRSCRPVPHRWEWLVLAVAAASGCADAPADPGSGERVAHVLLDVGPLFAAGQEIRSASVIARAVLRVTSSGGTVLHEAPLGADDPVVSFAVLVSGGEVRFEATVESNNGTVLFAGTAVDTIVADGFAVSLETEAVAPVLTVTPDSLRVPVLAPEQLPISFALTNRGVDLAQWSVTRVDPPNDSCGVYPCLGFGPLSGAAGTGAVASDRLPIWGVSTPGRIYRIRFSSPEGTVEVVADAEASPLGAIEAQLFTAAGLPVPGWAVDLVNCALVGLGDQQCIPDPTMPLQTRITDGAGFARFEELPVGIWQVSPKPQEGWVPPQRILSLRPDDVLYTSFVRQAAIP